MNKAISISSKLSWVFICLLVLTSIEKSNSQTYCTQQGGSDQIAGTEDGFRYELWNQNAQGTACITLEDGALFSGEWDGILNYLARRGLGYDQTQEHAEYGQFFADYNCDYNPNSSSGNSYLSIYGWTVDPLIEFYIIEDWRNWIPSMAGGSVNRGTIDVNGSVYDIIENTRTNQPSIQGTQTFQQYFSIRRNERTAGSINISDHFDMWESLDMPMGNLHEVSFVVEGYQSSGDFSFGALDVYVRDPSVLNAGSEPSDFFSIYPNPNVGDISIKFNDTVANASLKIYDASGKMVYNLEKIQSTEIQVSDLQAGMYVVKINNNGREHKTKLVVK